MQQFKDVTRKALEEFLESYPQELERDVYGAGEPPLVTWNDFTRGKWPDSVVAKCYLEGGDITNFKILDEEEE